MENYKMDRTAVSKFTFKEADDHATYSKIEHLYKDLIVPAISSFNI